MVATVVLVYPSGHDFDLKYYLDTHMPLVASKWKSDGLRNWEIVKFESGAPYQIQATLTWDSLEAWNAASNGPKAADVFGDIPNFTTAKPVAMPGAIQGSDNLV